MKNRVIKGLVVAGAVIVMIISAFAYIFIYETELKETRVLTDTYEQFELRIIEVGEPDFPFGHDHLKFILKKDGKRIAKYSFEVADDGCSATSESFTITWNDDNVSVLSTGSEQPDITYTLNYDGTVSEYEKSED